MKPQMRILPVAIAVALVIALILTATLMGMSYFTEAHGQQDTSAREEITAARTEPPSKPVSTVPSAPSTEAPTEEPTTEELGLGLLYRSYGDGTCILVSVGSCRDACVVIPEFSPKGDRVVEIAPQAFYGCTTVTAIQIPKSVRIIGNLAFASCPNLVFISVNENNLHYCDRDGVLFTADERELLLYPSRRAGSYVLLSSATVKIHEMAFYGCAYLQSVHYEGSAEQWEQMSIGAKNYSLTAAAKTFGGK